MAAKIKDGLFIGDAETSQSEVFINDNKISNLINLAGREVHNVWASHGLVYLTYYWEDRPDYKLFTSHEDALLTDIVEFIDVSISHGISVLLFSRRGTGRCVVAACLYLMMKYRWGFEKTYDYVYSKKPDIDLNKGFIQQMFALDMKLLAARQKAYAAKMGIPNTFKIEANMTINDISSMLPPIEAKRWNAWDPDYVLEGREAGAQQQLGLLMDSESKGGDSRHLRDSKAGADAKSASDLTRKGAGVTLSGPGTGEDDELILIYSFQNSKNTITVLPGPYLDVYSTHKDFKLKFNPVCFEEDVNWFPSTSSARSAIRGAMKGCRARHAATLVTAAAQPKHASTAASNSFNTGVGASSALADSKRGDYKSTENLSATPAGAYNPGKAAVALENIAPMYIINSQREAAEGGNGNGSRSAASSSRDAGAAAYYSHPAMTSSGPGDHPSGYYGQDGSPPTSAQSSPVHSGQGPAGSGASRAAQNQGAPSQQQAGPGYSNDLYEFVGMQNDTQAARSRASRGDPNQRTWGPRDSITVHRDQSLSSMNSATSAADSYADHKRGPSEYENDASGRPGSATRRQPSPQATAPQQPPPAVYSTASRTATPSGGGGAGPSSTAQLSAEERLRNLMADMARHKAGGAGSSSGATGSGAAQHSRDFSDSRDRSGAPAGPSLYELATMQVVPGAGRRAGSDTGYGTRRADADDRYDQPDVEEEDLDDPLSAFQREHGDYSGAGRSGGGAVRARHDVLSSSAGGRTAGTAGARAPPPGSRTAWASSGSRGTSPSSSRPASPSPAVGGPSGQSGTGGVPSRYASPSTGKRLGGASGAAGSVSSNLSVNSINSSGSNQVVGSGNTSSSRVYRYAAWRFITALYASSPEHFFGYRFSAGMVVQPQTPGQSAARVWASAASVRVTLRQPSPPRALAPRVVSTYSQAARREWLAPVAATAFRAAAALRTARCPPWAAALWVPGQAGASCVVRSLLLFYSYIHPVSTNLCC